MIEPNRSTLENPSVENDMIILSSHLKHSYQHITILRPAAKLDHFQIKNFCATGIKDIQLIQFRGIHSRSFGLKVVKG